MDGLSVVIPTWNGAALLQESLPLLAAALRAAAVEHELVLVDNGSEDDTRQVLSKWRGVARPIWLDRNYGFSFACNEGIATAAHRRVLLMNNDILVPEGFLGSLLEHELGKTFAVGAAIVSREEAFGSTPAPDRAPYRQLGVPTHCCLLDRDGFLELGGFDLVFSPAMWEEMDLGVRAWGAGREVLVEPRSRVFHYTRATVSRAFSYLDTERLYHRNRLLFLWRNLPAGLLRRHLLKRLPLDCASDVLTRGGSVMLPALAGALGRIGGAAGGRAASGAARAGLLATAAQTGEEALLHSWL